MILSALLILGRSCVVLGAEAASPLPSARSALQEGNAYEKYERYPPYCSAPEEMERRAVPPLQGNGNSSRLLHVTALIRHGARTPYGVAPDYQCWNGFWDDDETGVWDCDLKTYMSPPATTKEKGWVVDNAGGLIEEEPDFLFEKRYDALRVGPGRTGNGLNGTCQQGQLLMRGYIQELRNGLHMRQAYFYDGENTADEHAASDARMRLWDLTKKNGEGRKASTPVIGDPTKQVYQEPNLLYRADDEQRTLMSGQILLRGLFEPELLSSPDDETAVIRLHTADYFKDVLAIHEYTCPRTRDLYNEAYESEEYKEWVENSAEAKTVRSFVKAKLGLDEIPPDVLDCLMTTICTDRTLPDSLNDYDGSLGPTPWKDSVQSSGMGSATGEDGDFTSMFERIANFATKNFTFSYKYNDAAYAKLGMGPLWKEIMANILPIVDPSNNPTSETPPKLALFSGHDTTLMPILATLGEDVWSGTDWAPYSSMVIVEIHEITNSDRGSDFPSGYAFRLIYNGEVLTSRMDGCAAGSDLCDAQILVNQVMPFAKYMDRDCASTTPVGPLEPPASDDLVSEMETVTKELIATPGGVWVIVAIAIVSMASGGFVVWLAMRRGTGKANGYAKSLALGGPSGTVLESDDETGIDSAVPADYGSVGKDGMKVDENSLI